MEAKEGEIERSSAQAGTRLVASSRRLVRRLLLTLAVAIMLWLAGSLAVAHRLTRRPHRWFAEPVPTVRWGQFQSHRLRTCDGEDLGAWFLPGDPDAPAVLLLHGHRGSRRNCLDRAEIYARRGCTVLLLSFRAHGDSSGEVDDIGYSGQHDVVAGVEFLERQFPGRPLINHGVSMGAAAATFAAGSLSSRCQGYILESPYLDLRTAVRNRTRAVLPPPLDWVGYEGLLLVAPLVLRELERISPLEAVKAIPADVPILLLCGEDDHLARPEETRVIYEQVQSHAELRQFPRAGHHSVLTSDPSRYEQVIEHFLRIVQPGNPPPSQQPVGSGRALPRLLPKA